MSRPTTRPFVPGGVISTKRDAEEEARRLTRERDPEIWTWVTTKTGFAVKRVS